jgi:hypothetical protein
LDACPAFCRGLTVAGAIPTPVRATPAVPATAAAAAVAAAATTTIVTVVAAPATVAWRAATAVAAAAALAALVAPKQYLAQLSVEVKELSEVVVMMMVVAWRVW